MSTETSELNQPNDGGDSGEPRRRFGFLHADTGVHEDRADPDVVGTDVNAEDDTDAAGDPLVYDRTNDAEVVDEDAVEPQPTFTPSASGTSPSLPDPRQPTDGPVVPGEVVPDDVTTEDGRLEPTALDDTRADDTTVPAGTVPASTAFDPDAPLLGDPVGLRASWQQAAAEFVDDPRAAVAEAAELVEHTAQTLIGALQQRQRQLRGQWETGPTAGVSGSGATGGSASGTVDTEELRHLMQSYRALFNQLTAS